MKRIFTVNPAAPYTMAATFSVFLGLLGYSACSRPGRPLEPPASICHDMVVRERVYIRCLDIVRSDVIVELTAECGRQAEALSRKECTK